MRNSVFLYLLSLLLLAPAGMTAQSQVSVGTPAGIFAVSPMGGATYSIPIEVPSGIGGMEPKVSIDYNSQSGNGLCGFGCNIGGISVITRGVRDIYHDGVASGISHGMDDAFFLDGQRLIMTQTAAGSDSAVYCLETDPYTRVVLHGLAGSSQFSTYFTVEAPDGMVYEYGKALAKQYYPSGWTLKSNAWYISSATSPAGNSISYSYTHDNSFVYPDEIRYGSSDGNCVKFEYEARPDTSRFSLEGIKGCMGRRLSSVRTMAVSSGNEAVYRNYALNYTLPDQSTMGYSRLSSVLLSNGSGQSMNPVVLDWNGLPSFSCDKKTPAFSSSIYTGGAVENEMSFFSGDLNGDGKADLVQKATTHLLNTHNTVLRVYESNINSIGNVHFTLSNIAPLGTDVYSPAWTDVCLSPAAADLDGDGTCELVVPRYMDYPEYRAFGLAVFMGGQYMGGVEYGDLHVSDLNKVLWSAADFDNDGKCEFVIIEKAKEGSSSYYGCIMGGYNTSAYCQHFRFSLPSVPKHIFTADMDCNGLADIVVFYQNGYSVFFNDATWLDEITPSQPLNETPVSPAPFAYTNALNPTNVCQGDFNGDGIADFLVSVYDSGNLYFELGNGNGTLEKKVAAATAIYDYSGTDKDDGKTNCHVIDLDGDGLSDVVISRAMYKKTGPLYIFNKTYTYWLRSDGKQLVTQCIATSAKEKDAYSQYYVSGDFNGDGLEEVASLSYDCYSSTNANENAEFRIYENSSWHAGAGKVGTFTDGLGSSTAVTYRPLTDSDVYSRSFNAANTFPLLTLTAPLPVVYEASAGNGSAGTVTTRYSYGDLQYHCQGRGLLGFNTTSADNLTTGVYTVSTVTRNSQTLLPQQTETRQIIGNVWSTDVSSYLSHPHHNTRALYHTLLSTVSTDFDGNTTTTAFVSDSTRNNVPLSVTVEGWDGARVTTAYSGYVQRGRRYLPQTVTETRHHPDHGSDFTQVTTRQYNAKGLTATEVLNAGTAKALTTSYAYDSRGNVTQTVTTGQDIETVTVLYDYDDSHRFVTRKTERGYMVTDYTRDLWGNVLSETDRTRSAYPETTAYTYDGWGRLTATEYPTGETATRTIGWDATPAMRYYVLEQCDGRPWVKTWYDNNGRMQRRQTIGQKNLSISETFSYDARGLMTGHTTQRGSQSVTAAMTYDSRGRLLTDTDDFGRNLSYSYGTNSVTTTDNGRSFTRTFDSWGNVKQSTDPVSQVTYKYHACGKPKQATSAGAVVTMGYDTAGNRTSLTDPDAGTMTYSYDALGRIRTQTDGNGILTANTYNSRGQLSQSVSGTVTTTYTYGQGPSDNGLLTVMGRGQFSETFLYDACRRVTQDTRNFGGGITRTLTYEYDSIGRLAARGYPGGLTVSYDYDAGGFLERLRSGGSTVYELQSYGGNVSTEKLGSTMTRIRSFDRKDRPLTSLTVAAGSTLAYLTQGYTWNSGTGNLTSRTINGSTEQFTYDSLNRLTGASVSGGTGTYVMYDTNGNIDVKHGTAHPIGSYYYDSSRPHAVTDIENPLGAVDLPSDYVTVSYNELGKAATVTDDGNPYITYHYGPDHERWRGVQHQGGSTWSNLYFGDYEERYVNSNSRRCFVYLDGGVLAVSDNGGSYQFYYIHTDHQGSILAITDAQGSYVFKASYDAWGRQTVTQNTLAFQRGYTGHEMMKEGGLINMNGRIYDSALGLFLSPDNYVQEPLNSQNFNRYSYCLNNPLKYVDPDGEFFWLPVIIGAVIGGSMNLGMQAVNGNVSNFWKGLSAFTIGAIAGGAGGAAGGWTFSAMGGSAAGGGGFLAGFASGAVSSAVTMGTQNIGNHFAFGEAYMSMQQYLLSVATSAFLGGFANGALAAKNGNNFWNGKSLTGFNLNISPIEPAPIPETQTSVDGPQMRNSLSSSKITQETPEAIAEKVMESSFFSDKHGNVSVYYGKNGNNIEYVGITNDPIRRFEQHSNSITPRANLDFHVIKRAVGLSRLQARIIEQNLINYYQMNKFGGQLLNQINSISPRYWNNYGIQNSFTIIIRF